MFIKPITVGETTRIALTPKVDGKLDPEEWDPLSTADGASTYFQWEPEKIHLAATFPAGQDIIFSIDGHGDGWLVGKDNLEVRVHWNGTSADVTERILDNTPVTGPAWVDASNYMAATVSAGSSDEKGRNVEISIADPGMDTFPSQPGTIGVRYDLAPEATVAAEPYMPRVMMPVHVAMDRGTGLPAGFQWKPEFRGRSVVPGQATKIRLTFNGHDELGLKRVELQTAGLGRDSTISQGMPFPKFDAKNRAYVDYNTKVTPDAALGYRTLRANVIDDKGHTSVIETSYEVAPYVSFDFVEKKTIASSSEPQTVRLTTYIRSNTLQRVDGVFRVEAPDGWKLDSGSGKGFIIYNPRGGKRQVFSIVVPGGFKGTAPIKLIADFAGVKTSKTVYLVVN